MAKKSLTGKRYFEWLGQLHERYGFSGPIFYGIYEHRIKKWPVWAQQARIFITGLHSMNIHSGLRMLRGKADRAASWR